MRLVAFLRAINVGGRVVRMEQLRAIVAGQGFANVETFIASGNVIIDGRASRARAAERAIEAALRTALGYEVATFVRTDLEVAAVAAAEPFPSAEVERALAYNVAFLKAPLEAAERTRLMTLQSDIDRFETVGREVFWLCRVRQSESTFSTDRFERVVGVPATLRGLSTVRKLAAKYPPDAR
jgi:uncharacterized protein (DUF1697 family)